MVDPFVGMIQMIAFPFAPQGWANCDGAELLIQNNAALYSLIGVQFGGDPKTKFLLPDLRGRTPVHTTYTTTPRTTQGGKGGEENVALTTAQMAIHGHSLQTYNENGDRSPPFIPTNLAAKFGLANAVTVTTTSINKFYSAASQPVAALSNDAVSIAGGGVGHNNMQPSIVLKFVIALNGYYPSRN
jgi:microcystin-dependent protein